MLSFGFPPLSSPDATILVLGSLPGRASLERSEYYANPRNGFWPIMATYVPDLPSEYPRRVASVVARRVALWDVLAVATRVGSLDSAISDDAIANNFRAFFFAHPQIRLICFNGAKACDLYRRHVMPVLVDAQRAIEQCALPSTSPAHAGMTLERKAKEWAVVWTRRP